MIDIQLAVFHDFRLFFPNTPLPSPSPKKRSYENLDTNIFDHLFVSLIPQQIYSNTCSYRNNIPRRLWSKNHDFLCSFTASFDNTWTLQNFVLGIPLDSLQSVLYLYLQCRKYVVKENIHDLKYSISFAKKVKSLHINALIYSKWPR